MYSTAVRNMFFVESTIYIQLLSLCSFFFIQKDAEVFYNFYSAPCTAAATAGDFFESKLYYKGNRLEI